ncbi:unnamed protein product [Cunninghamella blakesleeana]
MQNNFIVATITAAQAAGMTNYGRHFGRQLGDASKIYATTTAVQQDIYRLERDLEKILQQNSTLNRHASFCIISPDKLFNNNNSNNDNNNNNVINIDTNYPENVKHVTSAMSSVLETIKKHKLSNHLPRLTDILNMLTFSFLQTPIIVQKCIQALDIFDYICDRFKHFDSTENYEQLLFCCKLLVVNDNTLKERIIITIKSLLARYSIKPTNLPSTPSAIHTILYVLIDALVNHSEQNSEIYILSNQTSTDDIFNNILGLIDELSNGNIIPIMGDHWKRYCIINDHQQTNIPTVVAKLCVIEGIIKTSMVGKYSEQDPYKDKQSTSQIKSFENIRDKLLLQTLINRYWIESTSETFPAYMIIMFDLSELAIESFLNATIDDLTYQQSKVLLIWKLVQEKLLCSELVNHKSTKNEDKIQNAIILNITNVLMSALSITPLKDFSKQTRLPSSPFSDTQSNIEKEIIDFTDSNKFASPTLQNTINEIKMKVVNFWLIGYSELIISNTIALLEDSAGERTVTIYENLAFYLESNMISDEVVKKTLPSLFNRLVSTFPAPFPSFCRLLFKLAQTYKTYFYKPIVACVASDDHTKVTSLLTLISCLRRYMSGVQLWMQDAEMINVLLLSDVSNKKKNNRSSNDFDVKHLLYNDPNDIKWGTTTLGQCIIATEFLLAIRELRHLQQNPMRNMEEDEVAKKFLIDLERRLAVFMTAKEKNVLIPMPLRVIFCNILLDLRFFCNTTHRPGWLTRAIHWAIQSVGNINYYQQQQQESTNTKQQNTSSLLSTNSEAQSSSEISTMPIIHPSMLDDVTVMFERIGMIYGATLEQLEFESSEHIEYGGERPMTLIPNDNMTIEEMHTYILNDPLSYRIKRQLIISMVYPISKQAASSLELAPPALQKSVYHKSMAPASELSKGRLEEILKVNQNPFAAVFSLLVAVFTTLTPGEFTKLVRPLWYHYLNAEKPHIFIPAAFLFMQCGEKIPKIAVEIVTRDFYSDDLSQRLEVILKHASLCAYRFNILAQDYILVSSKRRPFRGDGGLSTAFVPTDLGSNKFTMDEPRWMSKLKNASNFPIELKRQIQELGWDEDDKGEEYEALKKVLTPLTLLPPLYLNEEIDQIKDTNPDETKSITQINKIISRRKRATTVPTMNTSFVCMIDSLFDNYGGPYNNLCELLEKYLCDDPDLFLRGFLYDLGKNELEIQRDSLTRLSYLVNMQSKLPPGFTHVLFNHLTGMLKWLTRENRKNGFELMAIIHPIITQLVLSTNELSVRDLRKNKIETLLSSTGRFWFLHEQPLSMFPRRLLEQRTSFTILDVPNEIFGVAMLRISHIQFLTNLLIRYPREVYAIKKTFQNFEPIPAIDDDHYNITNNNTSLYPDTQYIRYNRRGSNYSQLKICPRPSQQQEDTELLSLLRARVWLRFIDTLLNGLNKNYNDRKELEQILGGVNDIITKHSKDYGIIGQALILYTRVVTKFKRMFSSNYGYGIFLPALFKVYCQTEHIAHIRSAITFAWCRFYPVHEDSFIFQMLGSLVPLTLKAYNRTTTLGNWMIDNLFSLMTAMNNPPRLGATSDVLGLQLQVELDDHERSIQERIDVVSSPMTMPLSTSILKPLARSVTAPIAPLVINNYNNRPFPLSNFIKLFLTIIAYDPGSVRAEQFVNVLQLMMSRFYQIPDLIPLIDEGMSALVDVFMKFSKNASPSVSPTSNTETSSSTSTEYNIDVMDNNNIINNKNDNVNNNISNNNNNQNESLINNHNGSNGNANNQDTSSSTFQEQHHYGKHWQQNDRINIKMDFIKLIQQYFKLGGSLSEINHEKMGQIIRIILRETGAIGGKMKSTTWMKNYITDAIQSMNGSRNYTKCLRKMLQHIYTQWHGQYKVLDGSGLYQGLTMILKNGQGKSFQINEIALLIKDKYIPLGLSLVNNGYSEFSNDKATYERFCNALVELLLIMMENSPLDTLSEVETLIPTATLMGKIIIPICLQFSLQNGRTLVVDTRFRRDPTNQWLRLLGYVMKASSQDYYSKYKPSHNLFSQTTIASMKFNNSNIGNNSNNSPSNIHHSDGINDTMEQEVSVTIDGSEQDNNKKIKLKTASSNILLLALSLVAMKIIILRAGKSFDKINGLWTKLAYAIKDTLIFSDYYLKLAKSRSKSALSTPLTGIPSPLPNSSHSSTSIKSPGTSKNNFSHVPTPTIHVLFDFASWRFLEFIVYYKTPLILLLDSFVQEKLLEHTSSALASPYITTPSTKSPIFLQSTNNNTNISKWKSWGYNTVTREQWHPSSPFYYTNRNSEINLDASLRNNSILEYQQSSPLSLSTIKNIPTFESNITTSENILLDNNNNNNNNNNNPATLSPHYVQQHQSETNRPSLQQQHQLPTLHLISETSANSINKIQVLSDQQASTYLNERLVDIRSWTYRHAIGQMINDWKLLLKMYEEITSLNA